jgi:uncharacterized MAPEG superfamily protein
MSREGLDATRRRDRVWQSRKPPRGAGICRPLGSRRQEYAGRRVLFLAAVLAAQIAGKTAQAALGATVFFWARLVYWPVYLGGIIYLRTAVWFVSIIGIGMIAVEAW